MPQAPPGYADQVYEFTDVCRWFDVHPTTLNTWIGFAKVQRTFGTKRKHRRVFSEHEVFVIAMMVALHRADMPVSPETVSRILAATYDASGPVIPHAQEQLDIARTEAAGVTLYAGRIWQHNRQIIKETTND
ncbi:MAG: hypothetical protein ACK4SQ_07955 [Allorhizobium sp.]